MKKNNLLKFLTFRTTTLSSPWLIFLVTAFGASLASIDGGIVNVAMPSLAQEFQATITTIQWVISSYLLTICILVPLGGRLGDIYTKRGLYLLGMIIFTFFSALCGLSRNIEELIIFRLLQGVGAALLLSVNQAIIMNTFPKGKQAGALGINSMIFSFSGLIGPTLGGFLIQYFSWHAIFYINIPIGILGSIMCLNVLPQEVHQTKERLDWLGAVLFSIGITCLLLVLSFVPEWHWISAKTLINLTISIVALILFYFWQMRTPFPIIDLNLVHNSLFLFGNIILLFMLASTIMNMFLLPFYLERVLHQSPAIVGLFLFISPLFIMVFAPLSGYLADRTSHFKFVIIGTILTACSAGIQLFYNTDTSFWVIIASQALMGIGYGIFQAPNNYSILSTIPPEKMGISTGITSFTRNVSKIIGVSFCVLVLHSFQQYYAQTRHIPYHSHAAFLIGYKAAIAAELLLMILMIILALWQMEQNKRKKGHR